MKYKHLFFDLDHTLWDFERNSTESLTEVYHLFKMQELGIPSHEQFITTYLKINYQLWAQLDQGLIAHSDIRENRFKLVLSELGVPSPPNFRTMEDAYIELLPTKSYLLDGALDVLDYARERGYDLHIITNGFDFIQDKKLRSSGIVQYFTHLITNENAQARKPDRRIFDYAITCAGAQCAECLMIGDNWVADILGAKRFGMDTVFYNPAGHMFDEAPTYEVRHLNELKDIL
ncbi:YjjG family noncanonical pyrimidine nucleotidase [Arundinibacter roseus]|uniref:Noncanonical pyrimidine nucleotidase, YjjG family n=1 Tax=Arundinibacter roseus TaxID=2070510 RepID=A0A4R4K8A9_9BACT|nr:YjjG family noncanonical pyrimidine nucleotidase [Arundinibacter roseus]TDB63613.1 noncanonical pyrimidine nucleotidase, YjjG family [Arundinibacter roseus]